VGAAVAVACLAACARAPAPVAGEALVWGHVTLVPKAGLPAAGGGYGDRRVADVKRVDYARMKFAVVYAPTAPTPDRAPAELTIRASDGHGSAGALLEPAFATTSPAAGLRLTNATAVPRIVSVPAANRAERIAAGASLVIHDLPAGETAVHLLGARADAGDGVTQIWVTEGLATEVDASGRYALRGLAPGAHTLRAWHPRLPPSPPQPVALGPGRVERVDLEIGIDAATDARESAR